MIRVSSTSHPSQCSSTSHYPQGLGQGTQARRRPPWPRAATLPPPTASTGAHEPHGGLDEARGAARHQVMQHRLGLGGRGRGDRGCLLLLLRLCGRRSSGGRCWGRHGSVRRACRVASVDSERSAVRRRPETRTPQGPGSGGSGKGAAVGLPSHARSRRFFFLVVELREADCKWKRKRKTTHTVPRPIRGRSVYSVEARSAPRGLGIRGRSRRSCLIEERPNHRRRRPQSPEARKRNGCGHRACLARKKFAC